MVGAVTARIATIRVLRAMWDAKGDHYARGTITRAYIHHVGDDRFALPISDTTDDPAPRLGHANITRATQQSRLSFYGVEIKIWEELSPLELLAAQAEEVSER